ncbi:radial spoke head protein 3 homolog A isoform X1 [Nasonia vitripennis]|uniref:Radial spoke head protein 3 homolog n=1 Tax=Nasonia vitripennis TaxID=7425 RepID=A0A7M7IUB8_NASVI|nr:radial spoke head protein 3 homolog A isoform X1 [Nasonia vitripennis]XP_016837408.1 radial spoke head protein 3 homolog A isoform X1 [Nasonia vitripennis]
MPAGISALAPAAPHDHVDLELSTAKAFTILQKDGLDSSLPLLHVNGDDGAADEEEDDEDEDEDDDSVASRLTMINRNFRNNESSVFARRQLSRSNDQLASSLPCSRLLTRGYSKSNGHLNERVKPAAQRCNLNSMHLSTEDFNEALSQKLRRIQEQELEDEQRRQAVRANYVQHPRPFITTVKTGEFLMPPPEVAVLLGIAPNLGSNNSDIDDIDGYCSRTKFRQQLVSLNRKPEVRHQMHNSRCPMALKATEDFSALSTARKSSKRDSHLTSTSLTPRALPKKLDPIEGAKNMLPKPWDHPPPFGNLMFDRRIVRGSMFAATPVLIDGELSQAARQAESRRRQAIRKRAQQQATKATLVRIGTPPPVPGRKHEPVQTELFLEELFEKPDESEVAVQTDYFLDRPATPPFCPPKKGEDASTQIEPGDLFDYDTEVQPILEVLVGKTIEQALIEVLEEEEIATLREQQRKFLELRAAEKAEQQRLEEQDRRLREEKDRRVKQHEEAIKTQQETEERVAAAVLLTGYIAELLPTVLESLKISGFLLDEIKADVEEGFMPWLMKEVKKEMGTMFESREILEDIVKEIIENRANTYRQLGEEYDASRRSQIESIEEVCREEHTYEVSMSTGSNIDAESNRQD